MPLVSHMQPFCLCRSVMENGTRIIWFCDVITHLTCTPMIPVHLKVCVFDFVSVDSAVLAKDTDAPKLVLTLPSAKNGTPDLNDAPTVIVTPPLVCKLFDSVCVCVT